MQLGLLLILTSVFAYKPYKHSSSDSLDSKSKSKEYDYYSIENLFNELNAVDLRGTLRKSLAIQMGLTNPNKNSVCSPLSALLPLGKLVLGAEKKGKRELLDAIGLEESEVGHKFKYLIDDLKYLPGVTLNVVSKMYVSRNYNLHQRFEEDARFIFESTIEKVDFASPVETAASINEWVKKHTNGKIPDIITPGGISMYSSLILVNAVYFDAEWDRPFPTVRLETFYSKGSREEIPMMSRVGSYKYVKSNRLRSKIIEIPYKGDQASMVIVLPSFKRGIEGLLKELKRDPEILNEVMARMTTKSISLKIPKFKIATEIDLKVLYEKIKLNRIFRDNSDLTKIVEGKTISVSKAIQKAIIEVTEHGTEAAAASIVILPISLQLYKKKFHANRPFLFFVMVNRQQLFAGIFNNKKS